MTKLQALGLSFALHCAVLLLLIFGNLDWFERPLPQSAIRVSLSKQGAQRDQSLLPRIDASASPSPALRAPSPTKGRGERAPPKTKKHDPLDILKKRFGKPDPSGNPNGSKYGDSISNELAESYEQQVAAILRENYEIPRVITHAEAKRLKLWVRLWIGPAGQLIKIKIQQPSKNTRFDDAVLVGSKRIDSFGAPPLTVARKYRNDGLLIQFCPLECT